MKIAYFDCFSGISGDMILGALVDVGLEMEELKRALLGLPIKGYTLKSRTVQKGDVRATKVDVITDFMPSTLRALTDLEKVIRKSRLNDVAKQKGLKVMRRLIQAEAKAHGVSAHRLKLHGMDPVDTLVDIMATVIGLDLLGIKQVISSPIHVGTGIKGLTPATAELLKGIPIYSSGVTRELTTPTGAALVSTLATDFSPTPPFTLEGIGYGAGTLDMDQGPNVLRIMIGQPLATDHPYETDRVIKLETNMDDLSPQIYDHLMERLLTAGALDVYFTPIVMKKSRPATQVSVLASKAQADNILKLLFQETTTLGVRIDEVDRAKLPRVQKKISTRYGRVSVKIAQRGPGQLDAVPEYEECKEIARRTGLSLRTILDEVKNAAHKLKSGVRSGGHTPD